MTPAHHKPFFQVDYYGIQISPSRQRTWQRKTPHQASAIEQRVPSVATSNVRGWSGYPQILSVKADIPAQPPRPSRPGEFHPEPLTDPDLTLSRHPARATARRLPPSIEYRVPPVAG